MIIVGIALVVDELRKGQRLVFRYPEAVPSFVLNTGEAMLKYHNEYLSLPPDHFAKLFRPKASLFNKILEIDIGDLKYISFPTSCTDGLSSEGSSVNVISLFNVIVVVVRQSAYEKLCRSLNSPLPEFDNICIDPVAVALGLRNSMANIPIDTLKRVVEDFSKALLFEERRVRYVSQEVSLILKILDTVGSEAVISSDGDSTISPDLGRISSVSQPDLHRRDSRNEDASNTREEILLQSSLANELRVLYHDLISKTVVDISINRSVHINVSLVQENEKPSPCIKPFQTLLTIADEQILSSVLSQLQRDNVLRSSDNALSWVSPGFLNVLYSANPLITFEELAVKLELNLDELNPIVQSICHSGLGRVINTITSTTVYQKHFKSRFRITDAAARSFGGAFYFQISPSEISESGSIDVSTHSSGGRRRRVDSTQRFSVESLDTLNLAPITIAPKFTDNLIEVKALFEMVLYLFDGMKTVDEIISKLPTELQEYGLDIIIWLLRWNVIVEVEMYMYDLSKFGVDVNVRLYIFEMMFNCFIFSKYSYDFPGFAS